jgi:hypothetical protein
VEPEGGNGSNNMTTSLQGIEQKELPSNSWCYCKLPSPSLHGTHLQFPALLGWRSPSNDGLDDQWQATGVRLRLFVRMLVVKTMTKHVLFGEKRG